MRHHNRGIIPPGGAMMDVSLAGRRATGPGAENQAHRGSARWSADVRPGLLEGSDGCRADPFTAAPASRQSLRIRLNSSYSLGAFVGLITYLTYGYLNFAWSNWALVAVSVFMFLSLPLYSKYSNRIENAAAHLSKLETGGRIARYLFQLLDNVVLLWVFVAGGVVDPVGLDGIGGFFATAAWVTIVSQGGQYMANRLARSGFGHPDHNVVWAVAISVTISALAVSGVRWIQPVYVAVSLSFGAVIFGIGVFADSRHLLAK